jgi:hypothetical protein
VTFSSHQSAFPDPATGKLQMQGTPLVFRVTIEDGRPHRLSLYCLDYLRTGCALKFEVFDLQGHLLDTHRIDRYGEGTYVRYRVTKSLIVVVSTLTKSPPQISGLFIDPE